MEGEVSVREPLQAARWGPHLLYLLAIGGLFTNNTQVALLQPWQQIVLVALVPLVVVAVVHRNRRPYDLAVLGLVGIIAGTIALFMIGLVSMAIRRTGVWPWTLAAVGTAGSLSTVFRPDLVYGPAIVDYVTAIVVGVLLVGVGPMFVGGYIRTARQRTAAAAERALQAELERELSVQRALHEERERMAQEMHDSLGHALTLITMQAGALEVRTADTETANAAAAIRESARGGLRELRSLVHMLGPDERRDPLPGIAMIPDLVASSRKAGADVELADAVEAGRVSALVGRLAYQVVQEGLTNAHRHAPAAPVRVSLAMDDAALRVEVSNPLAPGGEGGAGTGLARLQRRAAMLGGEVKALAANGRFTLSANLPCEEAP